MSFAHLKRSIWHQIKLKKNTAENTTPMRKKMPWQRLIADLWNFRSQQDFSERFLRALWCRINRLNSSYQSFTDLLKQLIIHILPYWKLPSHRLHLDLVFARWCLSESQPRNCPMARRCRRQVHSSLLKSLLCNKFLDFISFSAQLSKAQPKRDSTAQNRKSRDEEGPSRERRNALVKERVYGIWLDVLVGF